MPSWVPARWRRSAPSACGTFRRRLVTPPEATVEIVRDGGSQVRGTGLEVDLRSKTIASPGFVFTVTAEWVGRRFGVHRRHRRAARWRHGDNRNNI